MGKRIEFDDEARAALWRGVNQLAGAVRVTLGPRGRNVILHRGAGAPAITNDGFTIAREIELEDPFENMGAQLLKEVAAKTGEVAGDGTTTATVLAHRIVGEGLKAVAAGCHVIALKRGIERAVAAAVESLRRQAVQVESREDMARIATVAANDPAIGERIAEALERVGRHGMVTIEDGHGLESRLEVVEGMRLNGGYLSPYFITDPGSMSVVLDDVLVLVTDFKLRSAQELLPALELVARQGRPLLLVADDVEAEALATLVVNRLRSTLASVAVRAPSAGDDRREQLDDLALLTGARLHSAATGGRLENPDAASFGRAKHVVVDRETTTIVEGGGDPAAIRDRLEQVKRELAACENGHERERLEARLARLTGRVAVIQVGAATEVEMHERRSRFEDALAATRAAIEEGIVPGGGVALLRAQDAVRELSGSRDEAVGRDIVVRALEEPARQIAANAGEESAVAIDRIRRGSGGFGYNAITGRYCDLVADGIVDAAKVARCALQNAASIGTLVLTTDAVVVESEEEEEEGEEEGGAG
jgi:chaperonin GroEL